MKRSATDCPKATVPRALYVIGVVDATDLIEETNEENDLALGGPIA